MQISIYKIKISVFFDRGTSILNTGTSYKNTDNCGNVNLAAGCRLPIQNIKLEVGCRLPVADSVAGCRLPIQNIKLAVGCRLPIQLPVADSVADSIQTSSTNRQLATSCRLPIQIRNRQYTFNESATGI